MGLDQTLQLSRNYIKMNWVIPLLFKYAKQIKWPKKSFKKMIQPGPVPDYAIGQKH